MRTDERLLLEALSAMWRSRDKTAGRHYSWCADELDAIVAELAAPAPQEAEPPRRNWCVQCGTPYLNEEWVTTPACGPSHALIATELYRRMWSVEPPRPDVRAELEAVVRQMREANRRCYALVKPDTTESLLMRWADRLAALAARLGER